MPGHSPDHTDGSHLLPLPASLFEGVRCREFEQDGRYRFEVEARLPLVGRVIRYEGWLLPIGNREAEPDVPVSGRIGGGRGDG